MSNNSTVTSNPAPPENPFADSPDPDPDAHLYTRAAPNALKPPPTFLQKHHKKVLIFVFLATIYMPYFIYFPRFNNDRPFWLTIFSYTPLYFVSGFTVGGSYYMWRWRGDVKQRKETAPALALAKTEEEKESSTPNPALNSQNQEPTPGSTADTKSSF